MGIAAMAVQEEETAVLRRFRQANVEQLRRERRLVLVLDLDQTLLDSVDLRHLPADELHHFLLDEDVHLLASSTGPAMLITKLRPYVRTFLEEANEMFELYVCTMGTRSYALEIASILDPRGLFFKHRVIAREDFTLPPGRKSLAMVLGDEASTLILDDTRCVWPHALRRDNLLPIKRYHFFVPGRSLSDSKKLDERDSDGALRTVLENLRRIHRAVFEDDGLGGIGRDVRRVVEKQRGKVLHGCTVAFDLPYAYREEAAELREMAEGLGATVCCSSGVGPSATHVVVSADAAWSRSDYCWALLQKGKFLVTPGWIREAAHTWRRQREEDFAVIVVRLESFFGPAPAPAPPPPPHRPWTGGGLERPLVACV